jgi:hypothetical protein
MTKLTKYLPAIVMLLISVAAMGAAARTIYSAIGPFSSFASLGTSTKAVVDNAEREPESFRFREDIVADDAVAINARVPDSAEPLEMALPLSILAGGNRSQGAMLAIDCLTSAVYYEAASESLTGQRAVAQVVLNRVRHPAYPNSVCGVVFQGSQRKTGCQFSFTCDGSLARAPSQSGWARARMVAAMALSGYVEPSVGLATHYHTIWVVPYWSSSLTKLGTIGAHIFYRWSGSNGKRSAFTSRYANTESLPQRSVAETAEFVTIIPATADPLTVSSAEVDPAISVLLREDRDSLSAGTTLQSPATKLGDTDAVSKNSDLIANGYGHKIKIDKRDLVKAASEPIE